MAIEGIKPVDIQWPNEGISRPGAVKSKGDFSGALMNALSEAGASEQVHDQMATRFADGDPNIGIHEVMIAAEKANIQLRYVVTLKNKLLEAYRDLMNTTV